MKIGRGFYIPAAVLPALFVWPVLLVAYTKNAFERGKASSGRITKLEQSTFL
jgi:hypothetical protein